jgi:hypothetical protein
MNVKELIAILETCDPNGKISIYVPSTDDEGIEFMHEIALVDRLWDNKECTGTPNAIGIVTS